MSVGEFKPRIAVEMVEVLLVAGEQIVDAKTSCPCVSSRSIKCEQ